MTAPVPAVKSRRGRGKASTIFALTLIATAVLLLLAMVALVSRLARFHIFDQFYYIVLVLWGLASAGILVGVLKGYAHVTGEYLGWKVELGSSVGVAFLVVAGGYFFIPHGDTFNLTVRLRTADGSRVRSGSIAAELGDKTEAALVHDGEAEFKDIQRRYLGTPVRMQADVPEYSKVPQIVQLTATAVDFNLEQPGPRTILGQLIPTPSPTVFMRVCVLDDAGNSVQQCDSQITAGRLRFSVSRAPESEIRIVVCADGKLTYDDFVAFGSGRAIIKLMPPKGSCAF